MSEYELILTIGLFISTGFWILIVRNKSKENRELQVSNARLAMELHATKKILDKNAKKLATTTEILKIRTENNCDKNAQNIAVDEAEYMSLLLLRDSMNHLSTLSNSLRNGDDIDVEKSIVSLEVLEQELRLKFNVQSRIDALEGLFNVKCK